MFKSFLLKKPLISFFILAYLISGIFQFAWIATSKGWLPKEGIFAQLTALKAIGNYGPMFAAMIMASLEAGYSIRKLFGKMKIWRVNPKWYLIALGFTVIQIGLALLVYKSLSGANPKFPNDFSIFVLPIILLIQFFQVGISEEIGWRGYALPKLQSKYTALTSSIILGLVWAFWHFASFIVPGTFHDSVPLFWYVLDTVLFTIILSWIFNNTKGSLLLIILFHVAVDATVGYLPYFFEYKGIYLSVVVNAIFAIGITLFYGYKNLSRKNKRITFEEYSQN